MGRRKGSAVLTRMVRCSFCHVMVPKNKLKTHVRRNHSSRAGDG